MPDFKNYSLVELQEAHKSVNRDKYPEIYTQIVEEIAVRQQACRDTYSAAIFVLENGKDVPQAHQLLQKVAHDHPGTEEAKNALAFLKETLGTTSEPIESDEYITHLALEFKGSAWEYFRIWIVNLSLSLITVGIFSAWAKVRKKRYIYSNLTLDGTPFQYLGLPVPILKGRVIASTVFLVYLSFDTFFPPLLPYIFVFALVIAPWVFSQSVAFNARYTAFRNMTFRFEAGYRKTLSIIWAWGIIPALILGSIFQWWGQQWIAGILFISASFLFPVWLKEIKKLIVTRTSYGGIFGEFNATGGNFFRIYFLGGLIIFIFGLFAAFSVFAITTITSFAYLKYTIYLTSVVSYVGYIFAFAYIKANITNIVWNKISLGPIGFHCTLKGRELARIYITNLIGIILTAGLLIPWAVIRTIRYRTEHTQIKCSGDVQAFQGQTTRRVQATGAELTDFFDFDLSI